MDFHINRFIITLSLYLKSNSHSDFPSVSIIFDLNSVSESITLYRLAVGNHIGKARRLLAGSE